MKPRLMRLDQVARQMNAWLLAIAIGLGMLDLTVLVAKCMPVLPPLNADAGADSTTHSVAPAPESPVAASRGSS
jgi:hypothetical protein